MINRRRLDHDARWYIITKRTWSTKIIALALALALALAHNLVIASIAKI